MVERTTRRVSVAIVSFSLVAGLGIVAAQQRAISSVTDAVLRTPAAGDWLMWRRTLNSWGYSPLDQINRDNVRQLALVWSRPGQINSARARVGCVTLADGSVLVTGGEALVANAPTVVDRAEVFQP